MNWKRMKSIFGFIMFFAGCSLCITAQNSSTEKTVYSFFPKPKKIQWIEYYKGQIDGVNDVSVALAYDGKSCKGLLTYSKSGVHFRLDGTLNGNELTLLEVDRDAAITGQLEGYIEGKNIHLNWSNVDNTLASDLFLTRMTGFEHVSTGCGNNQWIRLYKGIISGDEVELILQKDNQNGLSGVAYFKNEKISYDLKGDIFDSENINITIKDYNNALKGKLEGVFKDESNISVNYFSSEGHRSPTLFQSEQKLEMECIEYADYITSYDITFPSMQNKHFNQWIANLTSDWVKNCKDRAKEVRSAGAGPKPELRSTVRAHVWCEIDFYNDLIISGFMSFENTWSKEMQGKTINYDLKKNSAITLNDLFTEGFDHKKFVAEYLNKEIHQHELYDNYAFRKWLSAQDFPYFLILKDGLTFCTDFNAVYGRQKVKIPYEQLKPFFKENNVLSYLMH